MFFIIYQFLFATDLLNSQQVLFAFKYCICQLAQREASLLQYCVVRMQDFSIVLLTISKQEVDNQTFKFSENNLNLLLFFPRV